MRRLSCAIALLLAAWAFCAPWATTGASAINLRPFEGPPMVPVSAWMRTPVVRTVTMLSSSYCLTGTTATGARVGVGTIAAYTPQLPFGTRLYVAGYGFGVVRDDGPAIGRNRLDLWLPPTHECAASWAWGMRTVSVEVLGAPHMSRHVPVALRMVRETWVKAKKGSAKP